MTKYNINVIKPEGYIHSYAFFELAELVLYSLIELGYDATVGFNRMEENAVNIIIGCHLLDPSLINYVPRQSICLNTEQLSDDSTPWNDVIFQWAKRFETWDYSERNIEKLISKGASCVKLLKIGYQKQLHRIEPQPQKDADVLFYGSINPRRRRILEELQACGLKVKHLFGVYGLPRDEWISRSKVVLNCHRCDSQIFEIVRVFYLMSNAVPVVSEVNVTTSIPSMYHPGIAKAPYEDLVQTCLRLVENTNYLQEIGNQGFETIRMHPQTRFTQEVIQ